MLRHRMAQWVALIVLLAPALRCEAGDDVGPFVRSLWLVQRFGTPAVVAPEHDQRTKGTLSQALSKDGTLTPAGTRGLMDPSTFDRPAGTDGKLDAGEVRAALDATVPASRQAMTPKVVVHADFLTTSFDMIDAAQAEAGAELVGWIADHYQPGQPLHVTVICTGNSRRSILGSTMGNVAAAYHGMPEVRFHSGGPAPSAFNPRTIASLREIGVAVEPTGAEAPRGEPRKANPISRVRWGESSLETTEFSKTDADAGNPQADFAALLVRGEADASCPIVKGAASRMSMPYLDPKIDDASPIEAAKSAERRDDIGRLMPNVMMRVRNRLAPH